MVKILHSICKYSTCNWLIIKIDWRLDERNLTIFRCQIKYWIRLVSFDLLRMPNYFKICWKLFHQYFRFKKLFAKVISSFHSSLCFSFLLLGWLHLLHIKIQIQTSHTSNLIRVLNHQLNLIVITEHHLFFRFWCQNMKEFKIIRICRFYHL